MEDKEVKQLVNKIFQMKGLPKVTNFAQEFSDGGKYKITIFSNFFLACNRTIPNYVQHIVRREYQLQDSQVYSC